MFAPQNLDRHRSPVSPDPLPFDPFFPPGDTLSTTTSTDSSISSTTSTTTSLVLTTTSTTSSVPTSTSSSTKPTPTPTDTSSTSSSPSPTVIPVAAPITTAFTTKTSTVHPASTASSKDASASPKALNTVPIVGGIAGGLVGVAILVVLALFFVRRWRKQAADENDFDAGNFRRSAMLMDDPPTHDDIINRGYGPRPPTMIERKLASAPPSYLQQQQQPQQFAQHPFDGYGAYGAAQGGLEAQQQQQQQQFYNSSVSPGQVMPSDPFSTVPNSAEPLYAPAPYGAPRVMSPSSPPARYSEFSELHEDATSLTRKASVGVAAKAHYVDLSRSSVTPFQAAQYADISRRLNTEVPGPMPDPQAAIPSSRVTEEPDQTYHEEPQGSASDCADSVDHQHLSFPTPPANALLPPGSPFADPVRTTPPPDEVALAVPESAHGHGHSRIDSSPPMLPEISLPQRAFSPGFSSPRSFEFSASAKVAPGPSAFATESGNVSVPAGATRAFHGSPLGGTGAGARAGPLMVRNPTEGRRPDTVYTVYDPEDAYGGI